MTGLIKTTIAALIAVLFPMSLLFVAIPALGLAARSRAASIFSGCAAMVFLRKEPKAGVGNPAPVAPTKRAKLTLAPARAMAANAEAQRIWAEHERWLAQAAPKARAA